MVLLQDHDVVEFDDLEKKKLIHCRTASVTIAARLVVVLDVSGQAEIADPDTPAHATAVLGVTKTTATIGNDIEVQTYGELIDASFSFSTNKAALFLTSGGVLSETAPSTGFVVQVGHVVNATTIWINPSQEIPVGTSLPVVDTVALVKGSADPSSRMRFEVDGISPLTTRVITMPDNDVDLGADFGTAAQGATADAALPRAGGTMTGDIVMAGTEKVDGRDLSADGVKLDNIAPFANAYVHPNHSGDVFSVSDGAQTIQPNAVTTAKIINGAVTAPKIDTDAVTTVKIQDDAVTLAKMAEMDSDSFIGRLTSGAGNPEILSAADALDILGLINAGPMVTFAFRPGGVQQDNVYTVWADLMAAISAVDGPKILELDGTLGTVTIPSGAHDMKDVRWTGDLNRDQPTIVEFATGAVITNLGGVVSMLILKNVGTGAVMTWNIAQRIVFGLGCQLQSIGGAGPLIEVNATGCNLGLDDGALINNTGAPAVNVKPSGQLVISGNVATQIISNSISSDDATASMLLFTAAASASVLSPNHSAFSGTITEIIAPLSTLVRHIHAIFGDPLTVSAALDSALHPFEKNTADVGAPNVIVSAEHLKTFSNEGATAKNFHILPTPTAGQEGVTLTFIVQDADGMRIIVDGSGTIRVDAEITIAGGFIESLEVGASITLKAMDATGIPHWFAISGAGTWGVETS